jgi:hypothetical protein
LTVLQILKKGRVNAPELLHYAHIS